MPNSDPEPISRVWYLVAGVVIACDLYMVWRLFDYNRWVAGLE